MTISRGQMNRQLYMGGGIMDVVPREPALFGGIKRAVKKATNTVKKIAKSPVGKAAIAYGLTAGLGSLGAGKGLGSLGQLSTYAPSTVGANLGAAFFGTPALAGDVTSVGGTKGTTVTGSVSETYNSSKSETVSSGVSESYGSQTTRASGDVEIYGEEIHLNKD